MGRGCLGSTPTSSYISQHSRTQKAGVKPMTSSGHLGQGVSPLRWQPWCKDMSQGCDTSTAATDIPVWLRSGQPQKGTEQQSPRSSVKPRAALWGLPSTNSFLGAPLSQEKAQGSSHFHSSRPVKQRDNTPVEFPGLQLPPGHSCTARTGAGAEQLGSGQVM